MKTDYQNICSILQGVFNGLNDYICVIDDNLDIFLANSAWDTFSNDVEKLRSMHCCSMSLSQQLFKKYQHLLNTPMGFCYKFNAKILAGLDDVVNGTSKNFSTEFSCIHFQKRRWFALNITPLASAGPPVLIHLQDITAHREADYEILKLNEFLNVVLNSLPHPFYVINANSFEIVMANDAARKQGIAEGCICYQATHKSSLPCTSHEHPCPLHEIRSTKQSVRIEHIHYDNDGNKRWVEINAHPIFDENGALQQFVEYSIDITERKKAEIEIQCKTIALQESNLELDRFASTVSHDLKQPLASVIGYLDLMDYETHALNNDSLKLFIKNSRKVTERMCQLIEDLLTYSRVRQQDRPMERVDVNAILAQVMDNLNANITDVNARITYDQLPHVAANPMQLARLFQNLISNAIKFKTDKPPHVHISAKPNGEQRFWLFSITDNGIGIEREYLGQIFEVFKRLHGSSQFPGHGIGLATCKRIVEAHSGEIWAESEAGQGSTFYFTIPACDN